MGGIDLRKELPLGTQGILTPYCRTSGAALHYPGEGLEEPKER